jgi:hypothetical protein
MFVGSGVPGAAALVHAAADDVEPAVGNSEASTVRIAARCASSL